MEPVIEPGAEVNNSPTYATVVAQKRKDGGGDTGRPRTTALPANHRGATGDDTDPKEKRGEKSDAQPIPRKMDQGAPTHKRSGEEEIDRIPPLYIKHADIMSDLISGLDIAIAVNQQIGHENNVDMVQERSTYRKERIWRLYLRTHEARADVLEQQLYLADTTVPIYTSNPEVFGAEKNPRIRVTIKDAPRAVTNQKVAEALKEYGVTPASRILHVMYRGQDNEITDIKNGDRYFYADEKPLQENHIPRKIEIQGFNCRVYYKNQFVAKEKVCTVCKNTEHKAGDETCKYYQEGENTHAFFGKQTAMSNMHSCQFLYKEEVYSSSEQAYQVSKAKSCGRSDVAEMMKQTSDPFEAKRLARKLNCAKDWDSN